MMMPARTRRVIRNLLWITLAMVVVAASANAQTRPYSLTDVTSLLEAHVSPARVLALARPKCIGFRVDEQASRRLRKAGMSQRELVALARVCSAASPARAVAAAAPSGESSSKTLVRVQLALAAGRQGSVPPVDLLLIAEEGDTARVRTGATGSAELLLAPGG